MLTKFRARNAEYWRVYRSTLADPSAGTVVRLDSKRAFQAGFVLAVAKELPPVLTILGTASSALQGEHDSTGTMIAAAELIAGAAVLTVIALEARHLFTRHHTHEGDAHPKAAVATKIDVSSLAAAALGYVEVWHHAHVVGHLKLVSPTVVTATLSLWLAFYKNRLRPKRRQSRWQPRRLHVAITPDVISYLAGPRKKWRAEWSDVAAIEHDRGEVALRLHDGRRHVLNADDHMEGERILAETRAAIAAHAPHVPGAISGATVAGPGMTLQKAHASSV